MIAAYYVVVFVTSCYISGRHVIHESAEVIDKLVRQDGAWWCHLDTAPGYRWLHGVSVVRDPVDVRGGVGQSEGIRRGVGMPNDALARLLRVLEVGLPLFPSPFKSRQPYKLRSFVREAFLCKEEGVCDGNKPCVRYGEAGSPGLPLCVLASVNELWDSWVFYPPG